MQQRNTRQSDLLINKGVSALERASCGVHGIVLAEVVAEACREVRLG